MEHFSIDLASTALVLVDLQNGNVARELAPYSAEQVVGNCVLLAGEMRNRGAMVVYVRVLMNELQPGPSDAPLRAPGSPAPPPDASHLADNAGVEATDIVVTKRQWGAFYGTELDQLLRRRGIKTLILGGIVTNFGVESTARAAHDRGYAIVFAEDAMSGITAEAHNFACANIFRVMGRVRSTKVLIDMLQEGTGDA
ncbi:isochorismatase family protein [Massilia sp. Dwa41.01b]|uniref:isochorismatase family protein n=1 Tax=unclassified Massilia TaxID=2609279 RepID=UPI001602AAE6|nr:MULTISPECIES: isochorismatase family protein [unclassified Massilia]QNA87739.1 isochorismatase family protein [Massilia sp. Dwa41.01b]QNA98640.1 isochorismatase family protein [Massilia sp. Se16.2.3]